MSKKRTKSVKKSPKAKASQAAKVVKHQLFCVLPVSDESILPATLDFFRNTNQPANLILVGQQEATQDYPENIHWVNSSWTSKREAFQAGLAAIEDENCFVSFVYEETLAYLPLAIRWFYAKRINATTNLAIIGSLEESGKLTKLTHQVWSPVQTDKPLSHLNIFSKDLAEAMLDSFEALELPIEQTRFLRNHDATEVEMPLAKGVEKSLILDKMALVGLNAKLLLNDFFINPLTSLKRSQNVMSDLQQGNHPIYKLVFAAIFIFFLGLMSVVSFDYGLTWDEPGNVEYAQDIYNYYKTGGADRMVFDLEKRHARNALIHYGASFDFFAYLVQEYISPFDVYETRHLLNAIVGVLIALFVGRIGKEMGNWRMACLALLFILLSPRFFGHSMNNHKDIPFMLGYVMGIYYLIRFCRQLPNPRVSTMIWLSLGMAYGISIRIGGLLIIAYFVMFFGLTWLGQLTKNAGKAFKYIPRYLMYGGGIVFASYMLGIVFWPYGIEKPFTNPFLSLSQFTNFKFLTTYEIFDGVRMLMENPPAEYIPKWIWVSVPLFVLIGLLLSIPRFIHKLKETDKFVFFMLAFTMIFPVVYVIYKESTLYSGWRHVLFVYGPMVVLAAYGWEYLFELSKKKLVNIGVAVALAGLVAMPAYWMVKNHPNQYVYFNELVGGINGAYTNYETEYWPNGVRQAIEWLVENEPVRDKRIVIATNFEITATQYYANKLADSIQVIWCRENQKYNKNWDYAFFGSRTLSKEAIKNTYPPKGTIHSIKADTVPLVAIVKRENTALYEAFQAQKQRQFPLAIQKVNEYLAYEPTNLEALRLKGILHLNLGKYDEAIPALQRCIELNPDDYSAYTLLGTCFRLKKQLDKALEVLHKGQKLRVNNAGIYHALGLVYAQKENFQVAYKNFDSALRYSNYKNANMIYDVSRVQIQHGQKFKDNAKFRDERMRSAIKNLNRVLQLRPKDRRAINNIAFCYLQLKDTANYQKYAAMLR